MTRDLYDNPNLNTKEWWKKIPDSREYGVIKNELQYSYQSKPDPDFEIEDIYDDLDPIEDWDD